MNLQGLSGVSAYLVYLNLVFSMRYLHRFNMAHNAQLAIIEKLKMAEGADREMLINELTSDKFTKVFYSAQEIVDIFKASSDEEKKGMFIEAMTISKPSDNDMMRLLAMHEDINGVPYSPQNLGNIPISELMPKSLETLLCCSHEHVDFSLLTDDEREAVNKYRVPVQDELGEILVNNPNLSVGDLLSLSVKKALRKLKG